MSEQRPFGLRRRLHERFLTGLVILLPVFITLRLSSALFRLVDGTITAWMQRILTC
jgi:uncharacterized membrane protein